MPITLTLDDRIGAKELQPHLASLGVPVALEHLDYGDAAFLGNGPLGEGTVPVGVERKTIGDLLQCMTDGRFTGHQVPGMLANYTDCWLIVEGIWRESPSDGVLEVLQGRDWRPITWSRISAASVIRFLVSVRLELGFQVVETQSQKATAKYLSHLLAWYDKDKHDSVRRKHQPPTTSMWGGKLRQAEKTAQSLPDIGDKMSAVVADHFGTVEAMVAATREDWLQVKGVGKVMADRIWHAWRRRD